MVEDIPTEMREEPLKPLEQSTEVEEMPIRALGAVSKTDGRIIPEESMMVPESSLEAHYEALRGALLKLSCWLMVRRLEDLVLEQIAITHIDS